MRRLAGILGGAVGLLLVPRATLAAPDAPPDPYAPEPAAVVAARAKDVAAYDREKDALHAGDAGSWVVIADGKVVVRADALEKVAGAAPAALHRFVFRVGEEGDAEGDATRWHAPRFTGGAFLRALGLVSTWDPGGSVTLAKHGGGASVTFEGPTPFPRAKVALGVPDGSPPVLSGPTAAEVLVGSIGPELMLTPYDAARLHLARWEVPGTQWFYAHSFPCRRALVRASIVGLPGEVTLTASVPTVERSRLVAMQRGRDAFWQWGGSLPKMPLEGVPDGDWIVFGNDRVLGHGATPEAAVEAADPQTEFAYHRFLLRVPVDLPPQYIAVGTQQAEPIAFDLRKFAKTTATLGGRRVEARGLAGDEPVFLVSPADAASLHVELLDSPHRYRVFETDDPKAPVRYAVGGRAWTEVPVRAEGRPPGTRHGLALVLYERPRDAGDDPIDWKKFGGSGK